MATCQTNNQMRYMRRTMPDTSCPCHETVPMNGCPNTRDFFPANMPIAMAYVPWQKWQNIYEPCRALKNGTIFEELNKPYSGKASMKNMHRSMNRNQLMEHINQVSFAVDEVKLYLDTHPCDSEALAYFHEMSAHRNDALKQYASAYGPLTVDTADYSCA